MTNPSESTTPRQALQHAQETLVSMLAMRRPELLDPATASAACQRVNQNGGTGAYIQSTLVKIESAQVQMLDKPTEMLAITKALQAMGFEVGYAPGEGLTALEAIQDMGRRLQTSEAAQDGVLFRKSLQRWDVQDGSMPALPGEPTYEVKLCEQGGQLCLSIEPQASAHGAAQSPALQLSVEINDGLPCVHVHDAVNEELQASIFGLSGGGIGFRQGDAGSIRDKTLPPDFAALPREIADFLAVVDTPDTSAPGVAA